MNLRIALEYSRRQATIMYEENVQQLVKKSRRKVHEANQARLESDHRLRNARCRLIEYILEKKKVETPRCRICPACLSETPNCFSFCLQCHGLLISHGIRPIVFEIIDDETDEEEETKRQLEEQIKKEEEAIFQETVNQAQREAEAESDSQYGFEWF